MEEWRGSVTVKSGRDKSPQEKKERRGAHGPPPAKDGSGKGGAQMKDLSQKGLEGIKRKGRAKSSDAQNRVTLMSRIGTK